MTRLRPEQVVGGVLQAASLPKRSTVTASHIWLVRALHRLRVRPERLRPSRYGDSGEDEFDARGGTIPQRLLLMNGDLVRDKTKGELFNASAQIAMMAPNDRKAVDRRLPT